MSITTSGIDETIRSLGRVGDMEIYVPPMQRGVYHLQAYMQQYPPKPVHSRYIRTGTLGRRWTTSIDRSEHSLVGKVGNNTSYGPFVQSERFQVRWHRKTGWRTDEQAIQANEAAIVADFQQTAEGAARGV